MSEHASPTPYHPVIGLGIRFDLAADSIHHRGMSKSSTLLRYPEGLRYHGLAVSYAALAYLAGLVGLFSVSWLVKLGATVLLAHSMIIAAYIVHEAAHNTVFKKQQYNLVLGRLMSWICGGSYNKFEDIRFKHLRHHVENDDIVWFDYENFFLDHPVVSRVTHILEWFYIPAHEVIMHAVMVFNSFIIPERREQRIYNISIIVTRGILFSALVWLSGWAAFLYVVAYMLMLIVLRFMDGLQHDYDYTLTLFSPQRSPHRGDLEWEQEHTFSVPLSLSYPWVNWLTLNFGYHNAHHARPEQPWYRLPEIHHDMFGDDRLAIIPLWQQLKIYHQGRVRRLVKWDDSATDAPTPEGKAFLLAAQRAEVYGGNAASFLTAH